MNEELKALIDVIFDGEMIVSDLVAKKNFFHILPKLFEFATVDIPHAVHSWKDVAAEIEALPGSDQELDLIAHIEKKFDQAVPNEKSQLLLAASLKLVVDLVQDAMAFHAAFKA